MRRPHLAVVRLEDRVTPAVTMVTANAAGTAAADAAAADGFDRIPQMSSDGRYFAYISTALDNLDPPLAPIATTGPFQPQAYWRDAVTGVAVRLSTGKSTTGFPTLSADGRYAAFATNDALTANAVPNGGTGRMYLYDSVAKGLQLVSNATGLLDPLVSPDGRYVAFHSQIIQPGTPGSTPPTNRVQTYLWDRTTGTYTMVSAAAGGAAESNRTHAQFTGDMTFSGDGKTLFFTHESTDIVAGFTDANNDWDAFAYSIPSGKTALVSVNAAGTGTANARTVLRTASFDGTRVVLEGGATDLDATAPPSVTGNNVFVRDLAAGTTKMVSTDPTRSFSGGGFGNISGNGRYVAFQGLGLLPPQANAAGVYRYDLAAGKLEAVNVKPDGTASGGGAGVSGNQVVQAKSLSADGRFVAFTSNAGDLVAGSTVAATQVFVRDMTAGVTSLISSAFGSPAKGSDRDATTPALTPDGTRIAFYSPATDLAAVPDTNNGFDLFTAAVPRLTIPSQVTLVSTNFGGTAAGNAASFDTVVRAPQASDDGRYFAFESSALDLTATPGTPGVLPQVYWRDTQTGETRNVANYAAPAFYPSISADGRYVTFASEGRLTPDANNNMTATYIYSYDAQTQALRLVTQGAGGAGTTDYPVISPDGRYVAFYSQLQQPGAPAQNNPAFPFTDYQLFNWDRTTGLATMVSTNAGGTAESNKPSGFYHRAYSADSKVLFFSHDATDLVAGITDTNNEPDAFAFDTATGKRTLVSVNAAGTATGNSGAFVRNASGDGSRVVFESGATDLDPTAPAALSQNNVFVRDRAAGTTKVVSVSADRTVSGGIYGSISQNGRYVLLQGLGLIPGLPNATQVYRADLTTGKLEQVNVRPDGTPSDGEAFVSLFLIQAASTQALSADGRFVTFQSAAPDLVDGSTLPTGVSQIFVRDMVAGVTSLISSTPAGAKTGGNDSSFPPRITPDGTKVSFYSDASDLSPLADTNGTGPSTGGDLFIGTVPQPQPGGAFQLQAATATVAENGGTVTLTVTRTGGTYGRVTVPFQTADGTAKAGKDYTATSGTLTFADGQTTATITVPILDNATFQGSRAFTLTLGPPTGAGTAGTPNAATVTVTDDEPPPANSAPTISDVTNQTTAAGTAVGPLAFTVGDAETAAAALAVTGLSNNTTLLPTANIIISGTGANRTVTVTPAAGQSGTATVTLTVTDAGGKTATDTFTLTVTAATTTPPTALVGVPLFAAGTDRGGDGSVIFYNADGGARFTVQPFGPFTGGVRTASADFNGDGVADLVVGTGPGRATRVVILDGVTKAELFGVDAFEASFTGGVYVTAGDLNGDGTPDLVITPDEGGGPRVDVYSGKGFGKFASFFGIDDPNFRGGARASTGDLSGDGTADLIVVAGFGGGPRVAGFDGKSIGGTPTHLFGDFFAFEQALRNGIFVTAGDVDGDGNADLICGGGPGGGPRVTVFSGKSLLANTYGVKANFFGGDDSSRGGIRVAAKDLDGDAKADIVVAAGSGAGSRVTAYFGNTVPSAGTPTEAFAFDAFAGFTGGVFVG